MFPRIEFDYDKCTTPFDCKKCLRTCPTAVLEVMTIKQVRLQETDKKEPGAYRMRVAYRDKCSGCNRCVEVCPVDAISITFPQGVEI